MKKNVCLAAIAILLVVTCAMPVIAFADSVDLTRTLFKGCTGDDVERAQNRLAYYGYYTGAIDKKFGSGMKTAVLEFQRANKLSVDGKIGKVTWALLITDSAVKKADAPVDPYSDGDLKRSLKEGSEGSDVKMVQDRLIYYGYYLGERTGKFTNSVKQAVVKFQRANGLNDDGIVGNSTWVRLNSNTAVKAQDSSVTYLSEGDIGDEVNAAQERLAFYEYYTGNIDGIFSYSTKAAAIEFQKRNGLKADGKIGQQTWAVLNTDTGVKKSEPKFERIDKGDTGNRVLVLQYALYSHYYYDGDIDGKFDTDVYKAVVNFQKSEGITADGIVGELTYSLLVDENAEIFNGGIPKRDLQRTMTGYDVYVLQKKLVNMNYLTDYKPGYYDNATVEAVKAFQKDNHIEESGVCDIQLRRYIWPGTAVPDSEAKVIAKNGKEETVKLGDHGTSVADAQMRLKAAGYLLDDSDGIFGESTEKAVKSLQKQYGIKADGIIGPMTWAVLKITLDNVDNADPVVLDVSNVDPKLIEKYELAFTTPLRKVYAGSRGRDVVKLQQMLITLGYLSSGDDDGKFGPKTKAAVISFQTANSLTPDGIVGNMTYVTIYEQLGINANP